MKKFKRVLSIFLTVLIFTTIITTGTAIDASAAPATPQFTINSVTNLSNTNAIISGKITNPGNKAVTRVGFQIGTNKNYLNTTKYKTCTGKPSYINVSFNLNSYGVSLKATTTYYYRFFIITGGKTYSSTIKSFKTKTLPSITVKSVAKTSNTSVKITSYINNPSKYKIEKIGIQMGTNKNYLTTNKYRYYNAPLATGNIGIDTKSFGLKLKTNVTYYYKMYITVGGKTFFSATKSFKISK